MSGRAGDGVAADGNESSGGGGVNEGNGWGAGTRQLDGLAALLCGMAVVAVQAGYSPAFGAFLLGTMIAETSHRHQVERTFAGMKNILSWVFFVAIGMQIDVHELCGAAVLIGGIAAFTLVARPLAVTSALALSGTPLKDALRMELTVTPIDGFSFIIAQLGVTMAVVPPRFYPMAVGVSLVVKLVAPMLTRHSEKITDAMLRRQLGWLADWMDADLGWLHGLQLRRSRNLLWQLRRKRLIQVGGDIVREWRRGFSGQFFSMAEVWIGRDRLFPHDLELLFGATLVLLILAPLVAIGSNVSAMAMLHAEVSTKGHPHVKRLRALVETVLKIIAGGGMFVGLAAIQVADGQGHWLLLFSAVVAGGGVVGSAAKIDLLAQ